MAGDLLDLASVNMLHTQMCVYRWSHRQRCPSCVGGDLLDLANVNMIYTQMCVSRWSRRQRRPTCGW